MSVQNSPVPVETSLRPAPQLRITIWIFATHATPFTPVSKNL